MYIQRRKKNKVTRTKKISRKKSKKRSKKRTHKKSNKRTQKRTQKKSKSKKKRKELLSGVLGMSNWGIGKAIQSIGDPKSILWDLLLYFVEGDSWPRPFEWNSTLKEDNGKYILVDDNNNKITHDGKLDENHKQLWSKINKSKNPTIKKEFSGNKKIHLPNLWGKLIEASINKLIESSIHTVSGKKDDIQKITKTLIDTIINMDLDDTIKDYTDKITGRVYENLSSQLSKLIDKKLSFKNLLSKKEDINKEQVSSLVETKGPYYDSARKNIPFTHIL